MRIPRLYVKQLLTQHSTVILERESSHYLCTVLRVKAGRELVLFNGYLSDAGVSGEYQATLIEANKKAAVIEIKEFVQTQCESNLKLELACCLIKTDRMDWLLQKATELGVTSISPLFSEFTDVKLPVDRIEKKQCHWQQIVISACEQSGRTHIPIVNSPIPLSQWLAQDKSEGRYVLHPYNAKPFVFDDTLKKTTKTVALLVGPEGGLSDAEVNDAHANQFESVLLGPRILRAETAPLVALSILQSQLGDFS
jgi:16S rRNA (uracil1498-N3)-methyltransferase